MGRKRIIGVSGWLLVGCVVAVLAWHALKAGENATNSNRRTGTITGTIAKKDLIFPPPDESKPVKSIPATVYAYPATIPMEEMIPDPHAPNAVTDDGGNFVIENVSAGEFVLVIDYKSDGAGDDRKFGIEVQTGKTTALGFVDSSVKNLQETFSPQGDKIQPKRKLKTLDILPVYLCYIGFFYLVISITAYIFDLPWSRPWYLRDHR